MFFNLLICIVGSAMTQDETERSRRMKYHDFLREYATLPPEKQRLKTFAWVIVLLWMFFGIGPGAVVGN